MLGSSVVLEVPAVLPAILPTPLLTKEEWRFDFSDVFDIQANCLPEEEQREAMGLHRQAVILASDAHYEDGIRHMVEGSL